MMGPSHQKSKILLKHDGQFANERGAFVSRVVTRLDSFRSLGKVKKQLVGRCLVTLLNFLLHWIDGNHYVYTWHRK